MFSKNSSSEFFLAVFCDKYWIFFVSAPKCLVFFFFNSSSLHFPVYLTSLSIIVLPTTKHVGLTLFSPFFVLSFILSFPLFLSLCSSLCFCLFPVLSLFFSLSLCYAFLCSFVYYFRCFFFILSLSLCFFFSLSHCLLFSLFLFYSFFVSLFIPLCVPLFILLCHCLYVYSFLNYSLRFFVYSFLCPFLNYSLCFLCILAY